MKTVVLLIFSLFLSGCGFTKTRNAQSSEYNKPDAITKAPFYNDKYAQDTATRFGLMALFSELVYMRHLNDIGREKEACNVDITVNEGDLGKKTYVPPALPVSTTNGGFWSRWRPKHLGAIPVCINQNGLFYDTFVFTNKHGRIDEAVIAYRGTDDRYDWSSNMSATFGFEPKQYKLARLQLPILIEALLKSNPEMKIYATGHSLGGGLAQQAGFLSRNVKEVITFNTSPVTNWTYLRLEKAVDNEYPIIFRLYHGGEALEKMRFVTTNATEVQYGRHDIGVQFQPRRSFTGHSMEIITCAFARLIAKRGNGGKSADHNYEPDYISNELLGKKRMCDKVGIDLSPNT